MKNLTLSEIWIYPVKSLGGISLPSAKVLPKGLQYDRRFMLVDENNRFLTQRVHPTMALFKPSLHGDTLSIHFHDDILTIPLTPAVSSDSIEVVVWDDTVQAHEVSDSYSNWFSERLKLRCKLVFFPESYSRPVDPKYAVNDEHTSFSDGYPFLLIGQGSLDDLNTRLSKPVPMNRFRPNLVFTGGDAYEEETWRNFSIGSNQFVGVKPCARCVLTTVNQDTAIKGTEPLRTLAKYRNYNNRILFGQNVVAINHTTVHIGDRVSVDSLG